MILLWGLSGDKPLAVVRDALTDEGEPFFFLDQSAALETEAELVTASAVTGNLRSRGACVKLEDIGSAYVRPYDSRRLPAVVAAGQNSPAWKHAVNLEDVLTSWAELTHAFVVNVPSAMASNNSKPFQSALVRAVGFRTPETLITTDADAIIRFWRAYGEVVYKSTSGVRSIVSRLTTEHFRRLSDVRWCPTQVQQYVPGVDYRVHIVGREVFACRITSSADDYRYASLCGATTRIAPCSLPSNVVIRCLDLAESLSLSVAGIDLRRTANGQWYCFEVNPSPGYTYYEQETGQPIASSIAKLLIGKCN